MSKKIISAKAAPAKKKAAAKKPAPASPKIFKKAKIEIWQDPNKGKAFDLMSNLDLRYSATILKQLAADFELIIESRTLEDRSYENELSELARQKIQDMITNFRNFGAL